MLTQEQKTGILRELDITYSRSGGPGGQNVNKLNTKACLRFHLERSQTLDTEQKERIASKITPTKDGYLLIQASEYRSQEQNKLAACSRLLALLEAALTIPKARIATKPSASSKAQRLNGKEIIARKKAQRQKEDHHDF